MVLLSRRRRTLFIRRKRRRARPLFIPAVILLMVLLLARSLVPTAVPAAARGGFPLSSLQSQGLYREALKAAIPGMGREKPGTEATSLDTINTTLMALVDINPRDPRTFLSIQNTGMTTFAESHYPSPREREDPNTPPDSYPVLLPSATGEFHIGGDLNEGILIYHAHTTESFVPTSGVRFTTDLSQNVASLGQDLKLILERDYGIPVIHDQTIHDTTRSLAYREARKTAEEIVRQRPEIRIVVDLHRDGVEKRVTTADIEGQKVGKILLVVGTGHTNWRKNMEKARNLHDSLERIAPGISRGIRERGLVYNQDIHPGALLVEVGGHENSLEEVGRTLPYLARALAELLYQLS